MCSLQNHQLSVNKFKENIMLSEYHLEVLFGPQKNVKVLDNLIFPPINKICIVFRIRNGTFKINS